MALFEFLTVLGKEPSYGECGFPYAAQEHLGDFVVWYVVKQGLCPGYSMHECRELAACLVGLGIQSAFADEAVTIFEKHIHFTDEVDFLA